MPVNISRQAVLLLVSKACHFGLVNMVLKLDVFATASVLLPYHSVHCTVRLIVIPSKSNTGPVLFFCETVLANSNDGDECLALVTS